MEIGRYVRDDEKKDERNGSIRRKWEDGRWRK